MTKRILAGCLGDCVHVAGVIRFLQMAEAQGYECHFTGPATDPEAFVDAAVAFDADIIGVSYRLTPENARPLLRDLQSMLNAAGLGHKRLAFGGTPPVAAIARDTGMFEVVFDGTEFTGAVTAYLTGKTLGNKRVSDYPQTAVERILWKAPFPLLRHHFGVPSTSINPTVTGIGQIAQAGCMDVISLGPDQDAQAKFFQPGSQDPNSKGAGGVPFRSEDDLQRLYAASRRGNYPLMRSYSGTADHIRYADMLIHTINNAWCATSLFWFNAMDGRGRSTLRQSISEHIALMSWHGERGIPVEGNEPYHWGMRDASDVVVVAASYICAHVARSAGVRDYISSYMFESPPYLSNRMDLAKALAQAELAESLASENFRVWRQTRTGLLSYPVVAAAARAHLAQSIALQMALQPHIVHVVAFCEADHAASAAEVIESCEMGERVVSTALRGDPDMTTDPEVQRRKDFLIDEALILIQAITDLGKGRLDPLSDPSTLSDAVKLGLLDAPQLVNNPFAPGRMRTRTINGAIVSVDDNGEIVSERDRVRRIQDNIGHTGYSQVDPNMDCR